MDYLSLATFVLITTFTPGPNNISCASMGILAGYRKTLPYIGGICAVFFLVMLLCNQFAHVLLALFPAFEAIIHIASAVYILWLAYHTARASYTFDEGDQDLLGFWRGFFSADPQSQGARLRTHHLRDVSGGCHEPSGISSLCCGSGRNGFLCGDNLDSLRNVYTVDSEEARTETCVQPGAFTAPGLYRG